MSPHLECTLNKDDLLKFFMYYSENSAHSKSQAKRFRFLGPAAFLFIGAALSLWQQYGPAAVMLVFALVWFLRAPSLWRRRYETAYRSYVNESHELLLSEPQVCELTRDRLCVYSALGEFAFKLSVIDKIVEHAGRTFIFIEKSRAVILPHDRIPKADIDEFVAELNRRKAMPEPPPPPARIAD